MPYRRKSSPGDRPGDVLWHAPAISPRDPEVLEERRDAVRSTTRRDGPPAGPAQRRSLAIRAAAMRSRPST